MDAKQAIGPGRDAGVSGIADSQCADSNYVFHELTRSICPACRLVIDAKILLRDNKVYMSKRCPQCGPFMSLVYGDAEAYVSFARYNKPGTIPLAYGTAHDLGCPHDCGLCPDHEQHACLGIIEVNSACDMDCPLCFADAAPGFSLTMEEVEQIRRLRARNLPGDPRRAGHPGREASCPGPSGTNRPGRDHRPGYRTRHQRA